MNLEEITWNDGLLPGRRRPRLWIVKGEDARKFKGSDIEGFCFIKSYEYKKNGDWSNTTYKIALYPGTKALPLCSPLHGDWGSKYEGWVDAANDLGLPLELAKKIVKEEYPLASERLNRIDAIMDSIEEKEVCEIKTINVTKKDESVVIQTPKGPVTLRPGTNFNYDSFITWSFPSIEGPAKLMDSKAVGHGRRTVYTIRIAIES
jgi:hypothetical protein